MSTSFVFACVALGAIVSPLLTFTYVWQIKEWRIDRLQEHVRSEGILRQFWGVVRPSIVLLFGAFGIAGMSNWYVYALAVLGTLNIVQIVLRRQPIPVWTAKAICIVVGTFMLNAIYIFTVSTHTAWLAALPFVQPALTAIVWLALYPIDTLAKRRILQQARSVRQAHMNCTVIGITGSVGKTTTKELLRHILSQKNMLATPAYINSEIGVARWIIANLQKDPEIAIVEMGAYRQGEIATLCSIAQPNMGIITSIGKQHLALFKSQEALCQAKGELVQALPHNGHAYLNADNALCSSLRSTAPCPVTMVGTGGSANLEAYDIEETGQGISCTVESQKISVPIHGTHNITNVLLAIAVAKDLGMTLEQIAKKLTSFTMPDTTFSVEKIGTVTVVNDTHNASPSSFQAAIQWAKNQHLPYTIVTSGLQELGKDQDSIHTELGALASPHCDRVLFLHKRNAKHFAKGYQKSVELFSATTAPVQEHSVLLCIGRMPRSTIEQLLPTP